MDATYGLSAHHGRDPSDVLLGLALGRIEAKLDQALALLNRDADLSPEEKAAWQHELDRLLRLAHPKPIPPTR